MLDVFQRCGVEYCFKMEFNIFESGVTKIFAQSKSKKLGRPSEPAVKEFLDDFKAKRISLSEKESQ